MTYLITGGTGFIGAHVIRLLIEHGDRAIAFDVSPDQKLLDEVVGVPGAGKVAVVAGDITDAGQVSQVCVEYGVEKIVHTAAIIGGENPPLTTRVNCGGTVNIFEVARKLNIKKVVFASSIAVFGPQDRYAEEYIPNDAPHFPSSVYGATKSFCEACGRFYFSKHDVDTIAIRLPHIYGLGRTRGIGRQIDEELFIKPVLLGVPGRVPFGDDMHNWLYVEDAARALVMAAWAGMTKTRAFTAGGDVRSTAEVAAHVRKRVPEADITLLPGRFTNPHKFDTGPIRVELGYSPKWTIEQALDTIIDRLLKQRKFSTL
jgi:nucleoside-diphosphate-sugar epimerase